jgi:hypothetical protein
MRLLVRAALVFVLVFVGGCSGILFGDGDDQRDGPDQFPGAWGRSGQGRCVAGLPRRRAAWPPGCRAAGPPCRLAAGPLRRRAAWPLRRS